MSRWKAKHDKEHYYKLAKKQNYRSRASYKLKQLDKKYSLLKPDYNVVDLGAAPGGWSQVVAETIGEEGKGQIISVEMCIRDSSMTEQINLGITMLFQHINP